MISSAAVTKRPQMPKIQTRDILLQIQIFYNITEMLLVQQIQFVFLNVNDLLEKLTLSK